MALGLAQLMGEGSGIFTAFAMRLYLLFLHRYESVQRSFITSISRDMSDISSHRR